MENCEGWLSPGGHSSGGRALTAKVRGPRFNPGWLPVFHSSLKIFPSLSSCTCTCTHCIEHLTFSSHPPFLPLHPVFPPLMERSYRCFSLSFLCFPFFPPSFPPSLPPSLFSFQTSLPPSLLPSLHHFILLPSLLCSGFVWA